MFGILMMMSGAQDLALIPTVIVVQNLAMTVSKTRAVFLLCVTALAACTSPAVKFSRRAAQAGVTAVEIKGTQFTHLIFSRAPTHESQVSLVFIEGDSAWQNDRPVYVYDQDKHTAGITYTRKPVTDPTPQHALAFNLMLKTALPAWYITRPCYNGMHDASCNERVWTFERYSEAAVASMARALAQYAAMQPQRKLVLVGYSGGATLAVLLAARLPQVSGVITIAANLDTEAWANALHYEPLSGSLNPAIDLTTLHVPHITLVGDQDQQVPFSTVTRFLTAQPQTIVRHYANYDHVCCWEKNWPVLLEDALKQLGVSDL